MATGKKWTPEHRANFVATYKRMKKAGTWKVGGRKKAKKAAKGQSFPLKVIDNMTEDAKTVTIKGKPAKIVGAVEQQRLQLAMGIVVLLNKVMGKRDDS